MIGSAANRTQVYLSGTDMGGVQSEIGGHKGTSGSKRRPYDYGGVTSGQGADIQPLVVLPVVPKEGGRATQMPVHR